MGPEASLRRTRVGDDVLGMVVRQGRVVSAGGVIVGVPGAVAATRLLSSWLYGV